jgi:hypothetical protein
MVSKVTTLLGFALLLGGGFGAEIYANSAFSMADITQMLVFSAGAVALMILA